jgi:hypothetical protein
VAYLSGWQFVSKAKEHVTHLQQLKQNIQTQRNEHNQELEALRAEHEKAINELAEYALPTLDNKIFRQVKEHLGYGQLLATSPIQKMAGEQEKAQKRLDHLNREPRVQSAEIYIHPNTGNISLKLTESLEQLKIIEQVLAQYNDEPRLVKLFESGYKTPQYKARWWNSEFYSDWKWGDIYEEKFGKTIEMMSAEHQSFTRDKVTLEESSYELMAEKRAIEQLVAEHQQLTEMLADFPLYTLTQCRIKLAEHLRHSDKEHLFSIAKGDAARESLIKKIHGIEKKKQYLRELGEKHFSEQEQYINTIIERVNQKVGKFSRPKKAQSSIPQQEVDKMLPNISKKLRARDMRFHKHSVTIVNFHQYDYFDYQRDMLWWDVITDGRIDGNFIPEVNEWHYHHPDYEYQSPDASSNFFDAGTSLSSDDTSSSSFGDPS